MAERKAERKLATRVAVGGRWYGPDTEVPDDVAALITNPKAWASQEPAEGAQPDAPAAPGTASGARLATRVAVGGRWYGPDDEVPDDVAALITNPKAWEGGVLPGTDAEGTDGDGDEGEGAEQTQTLDEGAATEARPALEAAEAEAKPRKAAKKS